MYCVMYFVMQSGSKFKIAPCWIFQLVLVEKRGSRVDEWFQMVLLGGAPAA